jgi:hypothetical protein
LDFKIIESLSVQSFNDGIVKTIGSPEWKALISTAKTLYDNEKVANGNNDLDHCILCHQELSSDAKTLFQKYWKFLESKAESELALLVSQQKSTLENLKSAKTLYPKFLATDAGVKILNEENSTYLSELKTQFSAVSDVLDDWIDKLGKYESVSTDGIPTINLEKITEIINAKTAEESKLVDPSVEIATLTAKLNSLKHKKEATADGKYNWKYGEITGERFPVRRSEPGERKLVLLHFGRVVSSNEAIADRNRKRTAAARVAGE